ncbi:MAG: ParB N-terminal domain-containing protein [Chthonomonadales bacterium]
MNEQTEVSVQAVPIRQIAVDVSLQPRVGGLDGAHVQELEEAPAGWPPLVVVKQGAGYLLIDGFHRLAAAQNLGMERVAVRIVEAPPDGDLRSLAFQMNAVHGKPLSLADRRAYARYLLQQDAELSDSEVGRRSGLAQQTVKGVRAELEAASQIERVPIRKGADGKTYPANANQPDRRPGELPEPNFVETVASLLTPRERIVQRKLTSYFQRLAIALEDGDELEGWTSAREAADAIRSVLGEADALELAERLGPSASDVLDVAVELGYRESPDA